MPICSEASHRIPGEGDRRRCAESDSRRGLHQIEVIVRSSDFDLLRPALQSLPRGVTITDVRTCGTENTATQIYRGAEYEALLSRLKIELIVAADHLSDLVSALALPTSSLRVEVTIYDVGPVVPIVVPSMPVLNVTGCPDAATVTRDLYDFFMAFL